VLVKVRSSALNRADLLQRQGRYPAPAGVTQEIPGLEFAGEVAEIGPSARAWKPGDRVFGLAPGGAHAEYLAIHERLLAAIPQRLGWSEAGAVPEAFITAHDALWKQASLRPDQTVLITAVGSGVGSAAIQLARAMHSIPYGTSRTARKIEQALQSGLEDGLVVSNNFEGLIAKADRWTGGKGMNVVLDLTGGPYVRACQQVLAPKGIMVLVGTVAGGQYELDARFMLSRRLQVRGTVLRARSLEEKIEVIQDFAAEVVPLLASGTLRPVIDSTFSFRDIVQAHQRLESNQTLGKVVLQFD
jgi:NADPH:quinone reductase-like Zn-dependent oxidoreductase